MAIGKHYDLDTDSTLANNSDTTIASQKATKTYIDTEVDKKADPTIIRDTNSDISVKELVINRLTNEEYDVAVKEDDQLYLTPDTTDQDIADAISEHNTSNSAHSTLFNAKQDTLTTQTAYTSKGTATKVPQITTNSLGQVTGITEVTITQPTVNNKTITIQKNGTAVDSFTLNQSTDKNINITVPTKTSDITNDSGFLTSHQSIKTLKTDNTTAQTASSSETIAGSGTINLHKVSKTGSYNDLLNKPTIPTVNNSTITIQKNGTTVDSFTTNASSAKNIDIPIPVIKFRDWSTT